MNQKTAMMKLAKIKWYHFIPIFGVILYFQEQAENIYKLKLAHRIDRNTRNQEWVYVQGKSPGTLYEIHSYEAMSQQSKWMVSYSLGLVLLVILVVDLVFNISALINHFSFKRYWKKTRSK